MTVMICRNHIWKFTGKGDFKTPKNNKESLLIINLYDYVTYYIHTHHVKLQICGSPLPCTFSFIDIAGTESNQF